MTVPTPRRLIAVLAAVTFVLLPAAAMAAPPKQLWTENSDVKPLDPDAPVSMRAFADLASRLSPAVLNVTVERADEVRGQLPPWFGNPGERHSKGLGSGFIIHPDGYALTNHHVVEGAVKITVKLHNDNVYEAKVVGSDPKLDVALIKFEPKEKLAVAPLGGSDVLQIGEWVIAIGNPFGLSHSVTAGIVSAKGRRDVQPGNRPMYANFIQTDASINPGNSGGPLINIRGEVIGINTAINAAGQGIGFAVPINMIKTILPQLANGHVDRSYLGVKIGPVPRELATSLGMSKPMGALVVEVLPDTPADRAGLQPGDVVTHFGGKQLDHWSDLSWLASTAGTSKPIAIKLKRKSRELAKTVTLAQLNNAQPAVGKAPVRKNRSRVVVEDLGIAVAAVPKSMRRELSLGPKLGVLIVEVDRGSAAERAGIEPGDVILQLNYEDVPSSPSAFGKAIAKIKQGQHVALLVKRGERRIFKAFRK